MEAGTNSSATFITPSVKASVLNLPCKDSPFSFELCNHDLSAAGLQVFRSWLFSSGQVESCSNERLLEALYTMQLKIAADFRIFLQS